MSFDEQVKIEAIKVALNVVTMVIGVAMAWLVGMRLTYAWEMRKKWRELELITLNELYRLYGEFLAIWKLWNEYIDSRIEKKSLPQTNTCWELMERAAKLEASLEAIIIKIATERKLTSQMTDDLGLLRQAFASLRRSMGEHSRLDWWYDKHQQYALLKQTVCSITAFVLKDNEWSAPTKQESADALVNITSNIHEARWASHAEVRSHDFDQIQISRQPA